MVDVATGWTECFPPIVREAVLVVEALERAQSLFPWLIRGLDFEHERCGRAVVPLSYRGMEVTRSRAYKKNDQAFVEQKNGAVVRRLVGYGRFQGIEAARALARLFAAARLHINLGEHWRKGEKRAIHRRPYVRRKAVTARPSMLDPQPLPSRAPALPTTN